MHTTTINSTARLSGKTMINIKSRMKLSANKRQHMMTHDTNLFTVCFSLYLNNTVQLRRQMNREKKDKDQGKNEFDFHLLNY